MYRVHLMKSPCSFAVVFFIDLCLGAVIVLFSNGYAPCLYSKTLNRLHMKSRQEMSQLSTGGRDRQIKTSWLIVNNVAFCWLGRFAGEEVAGGECVFNRQGGRGGKITAGWGRGKQVNQKPSFGGFDHFLVLKAMCASCTLTKSGLHSFVVVCFV